MNPKLLSNILSFADRDRHPKDQKVFAIKGKAGTGKTEIIKEAAATLKKHGWQCAVATPTNKAAAVLRNRGIAATTIHSLLYKTNRKLNRDTGEPMTVFVQRPLMDQANPKEFLKDCNGDIVYITEEKYVYDHQFDETKLAYEIKEYEKYLIQSEDGKRYFDQENINTFHRDICFGFVLIVDESSMINAETWKNLIEHTNFRIISVGDVNQLDPVEITLKNIKDKIEHYDAEGENKLSPEELYEQYLAEEKLQKEYGKYFEKLLPGWVCNVNHRTKSSSILTIFENILVHPRAQYPLNFWQEDAQIIPGNSNLLTDEVYNDILLNADIIISWKNASVNALNNKIRELKFPKLFETIKGMPLGTLPLPKIGEPLYVNSNFTYDAEEGGRIYKGEIIEIMDSAKIIDGKNSILYVDVRVLSTGEIIQDFPIDLNFVGYPYRKKKDINACNVSFAYAITCHKAQGSQWKRVVIIDDYTSFDILATRKWRYTAITRAQELLTVIVK